MNSDLLLSSPRGEILFVQLPLLDHAYSYVAGNFEYASASLAAFIELHLNGQAAMVPRTLSFFADDHVIASYIIKRDPSMVAFSTYMWNAERHLAIALLLKRAGFQGSIVLGGPEVEPGSFLFDEKRDMVDLFISGEGEWFFENFYRQALPMELVKDVSGNRVISQDPGKAVIISETPEPLASGYLAPMPDGSAVIELARGCPFACTYCHYSRDRSPVRTRPLEVLQAALDRYPELDELYLLVPSLERYPLLDELLDLLDSAGGTINIHAEMRTDTMDDALARRLKRAGFRSLEIGIQTLTPHVHRKSGRGGNPHREMEGLEILVNQGMDIQAGIIAGLRGETFQTFIQTVDTLVDKGYGPSLELYPLSILPGTASHDQAHIENISYQNLPPYYYLGGWGMDQEDIARVHRHVEEATGFSTELVTVPYLQDSGEGLLAGYNVDAGNGPWSPEPADLLRVESSVIQVMIYNLAPAQLPRQVASIGKSLGKDRLCNVFILDDQLLSEKGLDAVMDISLGQGLTGRMNIFNAPRASHRIHLYQLTSDKKSWQFMENEYQWIRPVFWYTGKGELPHDCMRILVDDLPVGSFQELAQHADGDFSTLAFMDRETGRRFYQEQESGYVEFPVTFYMEKVVVRSHE